MIVETDHERERRIAGDVNKAWREAMVLGINKDKQRKLMEELAQLPPGASLAVPPDPPPPRSHKYATGLAEFEELEQELEKARIWGTEQHNARQVAENTLAELRSEFDHWRDEHSKEHNHVLDQRDRALDELGDIKTRLKVLREQIDRVLAPPVPIAEVIMPPAQEPPA